MKKLFAILAIAAAMAIVSCSRYEEPIQPVNNNTEIATAQQLAATQSFPRLTITGGAFPTKGRWQVRATIYNPSTDTFQCTNIVVCITYPNLGTIFSTEKQSTTLSPGASEELFLSFEKMPGGQASGNIYELTAYADCSGPFGVSIFSAPYRITLK